jgi:selenocysteine-specific elongation factor
MWRDDRYRMEKYYTIGFAGHVDHGKTTLVRSLTGIDTDRKAEEKRRGMSIEAGVARLDLPSGRHAAVIDVPGHTDFLKNTIRGLSSVDMVVMVVAADDGVMPQTREHLEVSKFFGAASGLVVLSKTDLVDTETADLAELEIKELLGGTFLDQCPIYKFSAVRPGSSDDIAGGIDEALTRLPAKPPNQAFRLWIDQVNSLPGHGTIVSGTVASGTLQSNAALELLPSGVTTRARSLESHGCAIAQAVAGQRVGINLHRVPLRDVRRGMCLTTPGNLGAGYILNGHLRILKTAGKGIKSRQRVRIYLGTVAVNALIISMEAERLEPGQSGLVQIRLASPVAARPRDAFVTTPLNRNTVIGGGLVLETPREKYRRVKSGSILPRLTALQNFDAQGYLQSVLATRPGELIRARELAIETGLPMREFERHITAKVQKGEVVYFKGHGAVQANLLRDIGGGFLAVVREAIRKDPLKKNITLTEVAEQLPDKVAEPLLAIVADALCREKQLARLEGGYCLPDSESLLDEKHKALMALLLDYARNSQLTPFSVDTVWKLHRPRYDKEEIRQLLNFLFARNKLARLNDNRFLSLDAIAEIKRRVARTIAQRGFITVSDSKELLGYGRWGGTHVFDYLNAIGFTVRRADKHYLNTNEGR